MSNPLDQLVQNLADSIPAIWGAILPPPPKEGTRITITPAPYDPSTFGNQENPQLKAAKTLLAGELGDSVTLSIPAPFALLFPDEPDQIPKFLLRNLVQGMEKMKMLSVEPYIVHLRIPQSGPDHLTGELQSWETDIPMICGDCFKSAGWYDTYREPYLRQKSLAGKINARGGWSHAHMKNIAKNASWSGKIKIPKLIEPAVREIQDDLSVFITTAIALEAAESKCSVQAAYPDDRLFTAMAARKPYPLYLDSLGGPAA